MVLQNIYYVYFLIFMIVSIIISKKGLISRFYLSLAIPSASYIPVALPGIA